MEDKLNAMLGNPQLMQQIMNMAQALGQNGPPAQSQPPEKETVAQPENSPPTLDPAMLGPIMALAGKTGIDRQQQALLQALQPYLSAQRLQKLEKAMGAARLAGAVASMMPGGIPFLSGR